MHITQALECQRHIKINADSVDQDKDTLRTFLALLNVDFQDS